MRWIFTTQAVFTTQRKLEGIYTKPPNEVHKTTTHTAVQLCCRRFWQTRDTWLLKAGEIRREHPCTAVGAHTQRAGRPTPLQIMCEGTRTKRTNCTGKHRVYVHDAPSQSNHRGEVCGTYSRIPMYSPYARFAGHLGIGDIDWGMH